MCTQVNHSTCFKGSHGKRKSLSKSAKTVTSDNSDHLFLQILYYSFPEKVSEGVIYELRAKKAYLRSLIQSLDISNEKLS